MNDEQFEGRMQIVEVEVSQLMANQLRARDTAQREALARLEAEAGGLAEAGLAAHVKATTAHAQLAEAVGLLKKAQRYVEQDYPDGIHSYQPNSISGDLLGDMDAFLASHAQAEQQEAPKREVTFRDLLNIPTSQLPREEEAQGAQAGDERADHDYWYVNKKRRPYSTVNLKEVSFEAWQARAALATQPAVPVAEHPVVKALLEVAAAAHQALEGTDSDGTESAWGEGDLERLDAAMDALDELPDDQPGFIMEPAAKAAWALRNLTVRGAEHGQ